MGSSARSKLRPEIKYPFPESYRFLELSPNQLEHLTQTSRGIQQAQKSGLYCDIFIVFPDKFFTAHLFILAFQSLLFRRIAESWSGTNKILLVKVNRVRSQIFSILLTYMYTGHLDINRKIVAEVSLAALDFEMKDVFRACILFTSDMDTEQALYILLTENIPETSRLFQLAVAYVIENYTKVYGHRMFVALPADMLYYLLCNIQLEGSTELEKLDSLLKWTSYRLKQRKANFDILVRCIQFGNMTPDELVFASSMTWRVENSGELRDLLLEALWNARTGRLEEPDVPVRMIKERISPEQSEDGIVMGSMKMDSESSDEREYDQQEGSLQKSDHDTYSLVSEACIDNDATAISEAGYPEGPETIMIDEDALHGPDAGINMTDKDALQGTDVDTKNVDENEVMATDVGDKLNEHMSVDGDEHKSESKGEDTEKEENVKLQKEVEYYKKQIIPLSETFSEIMNSMCTMLAKVETIFCQLEATDVIVVGWTRNVTEHMEDINFLVENWTNTIGNLIDSTHDFIFRAHDMLVETLDLNDLFMKEMHDYKTITGIALESESLQIKNCIEDVKRSNVEIEEAIQDIEKKEESSLKEVEEKPALKVKEKPPIKEVKEKPALKVEDKPPIKEVKEKPALKVEEKPPIKEVEEKPALKVEDKPPIKEVKEKPALKVEDKPPIKEVKEKPALKVEEEPPLKEVKEKPALKVEEEPPLKEVEEKPALKVEEEPPLKEVEEKPALKVEEEPPIKEVKEKPALKVEEKPPIKEVEEKPALKVEDKPPMKEVKEKPALKFEEEPPLKEVKEKLAVKGRPRKNEKPSSILEDSQLVGDSLPHVKLLENAEETKETCILMLQTLMRASGLSNRHISLRTETKYTNSGQCSQSIHLETHDKSDFDMQETKDAVEWRTNSPDLSVTDSKVIYKPDKNTDDYFRFETETAYGDSNSDNQSGTDRESISIEIGNFGRSFVATKTDPEDQTADFRSDVQPDRLEESGTSFSDSSTVESVQKRMHGQNVAGVSSQDSTTENSTTKKAGEELPFISGQRDTLNGHSILESEEKDRQFVLFMINDGEMTLVNCEMGEMITLDTESESESTDCTQFTVADKEITLENGEDGKMLTLDIECPTNQPECEEYIQPTETTEEITLEDSEMGEMISLNIECINEQPEAKEGSQSTITGDEMSLENDDTGEMFTLDIECVGEQLEGNDAINSRVTGDESTLENDDMDGIITVDIESVAEQPESEECTQFRINGGEMSLEDDKHEMMTSNIKCAEDQADNELSGGPDQQRGPDPRISSDLPETTFTLYQTFYDVALSAHDLVDVIVEGFDDIPPSSFEWNIGTYEVS